MYKLPPSVGGKQPDGRKPDPPVWAFGGADRFLYGYGKPDKKPGPDEYTPGENVGERQADGRRQTAPVWGFGTSTRDGQRKVFVSQQHTLTVLAGSIGPGPAQYTLPNSVGGRQPVKADAPMWGFTTNKRAPVEAGKDTPGPVYHIPPVVGPQPDGRFVNAPLFGFGASTRDVRSKVFISNEAMNGMPPNVPTPGPAAPGVHLNPGLGTQANSAFATSPRCRFAKESRWRQHEKELRSNTVPGPGAYG